MMIADRLLVAAGTVLADSTPSPSPSSTVPPEDMNAATITPGLPGFIVFFIMACALVLLAWDMGRRIRRSSARENVAARMAARDAQARSAEGSEPARAADEGEGPEVRSEENDVDLPDGPEDRA